MDKKYYVKIITGFREEQEVSIPMQEAHKAHYLFKHPEERGVFDCGVALIGRNIQEIKPDWNKTMGWNGTHELRDDDLNQIRKEGVEKKMWALIEKAKDVAVFIESTPDLMKMGLGEAMLALPESTNPTQIDDWRKELANKMRKNNPLR